MKRRQLLGALARGFSVGTVGAGLGFRIPIAAAAEAYAGKFFVFVQAEGGWDPTSFCDPKTNTPGEPVINHWAETAGVQQAGNVSYAPFAGNAAFFQKYYQRMLVINGVDAQTNSHTVGVVHNWSGRNSEGFPTLTALLAANYGSGLALPYLSFGGFSATSGTVRFTRLDDPGLVRNIARPDAPSYDPDNPFVTPDTWNILTRYRDERIDVLNAEGNRMPRAARNRDFFRSAVASTSGLQDYAATIPADDQLQQPEEFGNFYSTLKRQAQLAVLAFKAGVSISADLYLGGFDTHQNHDADHAMLLRNLTEGVDYLWDYAETEGLADRLVVVIASDFGRTNLYNADDGKDHWPIGSVVVMEKNQPWTNRVVGQTDAVHNAYAINPATLARDDTSGTIIYPKHVHKALRAYLGVGNSPSAAQFPFNATEDFAFFR